MTNSIAQLCPYEGGSAVYTARSLLRVLNDSIEYYDDIVCLQAGYYRLMDNRNESKQSIKIIPNPSNSIVEIFTIKSNESPGSLRIFNSIGECVYNSQTELGVKLKSIDVSSFAPGVYSVDVTLGNISYTEKLVIIR